jgi:hypothetical protein
MKKLILLLCSRIHLFRAVAVFSLVSAFLPLRSVAGWTNSLPEGTVPFGYWNSLALGLDQNPRIVYRDGYSGGTLRFLRWTGSYWEKESIEVGFDSAGGHASLALTPTGAPRVSYYKTGFGLRFAFKDANAWSLKTVDGEGSGYTSLKIDPAGNAHISYFAGNSLKYATWNGVTWSTMTVEGGGVGKWTSLALDIEKRPLISYYDFTNGDLKLARWTGSTWAIETVDSSGNVGIGCSLALDFSGFPGISYYNETGLKFAYWNGSIWGKNTVDSGIGGESSLSFDSSGNPHISYRIGTGLKLASYVSGVWSKLTIDTTDGDYSSLALGNDGSGHIAYGNTYFNYSQNPALFNPSGGVNASTRTTASISWTWSDTLSDETGYRVLRAEDLSVLIDNLPANATGWTQVGLTPNSPNQIIVQGFNNTGPLRSLTSPPVFSLAAPPIESRILSFTGTSATLSWASNGNPAGTGFKLEKAPDPVSFVFSSSGTNTSATAVGLSDGATYYFRVNAINGNGIESGFDSVVSLFIPLSPPVSPGNPSVISRSTTSLTWKWKDNSQNEEGFRVLRDSDSFVLATLPPNAVTWVQTDLGVNTLSQVQIEAFNTVGSSRSSRVYESYYEYTNANPPVGTHISSVTATTVSLSWTLDGNDHTYYSGYKSIDGLHFTQFRSLQSKPPMVASGLLSGVTYYFHIRSKSGSFTESAPGVVVSTIVPFGIPGAPVPSLKTAYKDALLWTWENQPNALGYRIYDEEGALLANLPNGSNLWFQGGLGLYTGTVIQLEPYNGYGSTRAVSRKEFTLSNPPTDFKVTAVRRTAATLSWSTNGNPSQIYYRIQRATWSFPSANVNNSEEIVYSSNSSAIVTGLTPGTTYYFRANSEGNWSEFSSVISTVTTTGVDVPMANAINANGITWKWTDDVDGETGYRIIQSSDMKDLSGLLPPGTLSWSQTGLVPNSPYQVFIRVEGSFGVIDSLPGLRTHTMPNAPKNTRLLAVSSKKLTLAWEQNGNPSGTIYRVYRVYAGEAPVLVAETEEGESALIVGLHARTAYDFFVQAIGPSGDSTADKTIRVTTSPDPLSFNLASPAWGIETVDSEGNAGENPAITLDRLGNPHIFYQSNNNLKQASQVGSEWVSDVIVSGARADASISALFDEGNNPHVSYSNGSEGRLKFLTLSNNTWSSSVLPMNSFTTGTNTVSFNGQGLHGSSLGLAQNGAPLIAYTSFMWPALTADATGVYLFYQAQVKSAPGAPEVTIDPGIEESEWENHLLFAKKTAKGPSGESSSGVGQIKMAVDGKGNSHIAFFHADDKEIISTAVGDIQYGRGKGQNWVSEIVEKGVAEEDSAIDIQVDTNDRPHLVYTDSVHQKIRYGVKEESGWTIETVDEGKFFGFVGLALNASDIPSIVYTDVENGDLRFALRKGGQWEIQTVDSGEGETGWYPSMAIDSTGNLHIAYQDLTNEDLKYATLRQSAAEVHASVQIAGGHFEFFGPRGPVKIDITAGTFTQEVILTLRSPDSLPIPAASRNGLKPLGVGLEILTNPAVKPSLPVILTLSYSEEDLMGQSESRLTLAYYDEKTGDWVALPTRVNSSTNQLTATVQDFSLLQIMMKEQGLHVGEAMAFPNPLRPGLAGHDKMTFDRLPAGTHLKIYTLRGELVRELAEEGAGIALWDGRNSSGESVASGVYFVRCVAESGDKILKVAVQR